MLINTQQAEWAGGLREELLNAAMARFNQVAAAGRDTSAA